MADQQLVDAVVQYLAAGGDAAIMAVVYFIYRLERRIFTVERHIAQNHDIASELSKLVAEMRLAATRSGAVLNDNGRHDLEPRKFEMPRRW